MTRALSTLEVKTLSPGDAVARIRAIGEIECGTVDYLTSTQVVVRWPSEEAVVRYAMETGRRLGCHGEVLRAVSESETLPDVEQVVTDLGHGTANVEPNDEAQVIATVKADRARAKKMTDRQWLNAVNRFLLERLTWEKASTQEEYELQLAMATDGTEPHRIAVRDLAKREAPYITAASLSAWVVRQRRVAADFIDFTELC